MTPKKANPGLNDKNPPGDPIYSSKDDIYSRHEKESFDEEVAPDTGKEDNIPFSEGLDVPGAELDDADEIIGEEDEENNYYSLGGDNHDDPDE